MHKEKTTYRLLVDYLKGTLSNKERHTVEKETLEDPFLEDALDGFESIDAQALEKDIAALTKKMAKRTTSQSKSFSFYRYPIAASVILIIGFSFWWFLNKEVVLNTPSVVHEETKENPLFKEPSTIEEPPIDIVFQEEKIEMPEISKPISEKDLKKEAPVISEEKTGTLVKIANETIVEDELEAPVNTVEEIVVIEKEPVEIEKPQMSKRKTAVVADIATIDKEETSVSLNRKSTLNGKKANDKKSKRKNEIEESKEMIVLGKVTVKGKPIKYVAVIVKGDINRMTETDVAGNYSIVTAKGETLLFSYVGYERKEVLVENSTQINIELDEEVIEALLQAVDVNPEKEEKEVLAAPLQEAIPFNESKENFKIWVKNSLKIRYPEIVFDTNIKMDITISYFGEVVMVDIPSYLTKKQIKALSQVLGSSPNWTPAKNEKEQDISSNMTLNIDFGR